MKILICIILFSLTSVCVATTASLKQVVVTIKPIHALVSGVMEGVGTPQLLLQGGESPHTYSLRPSQVQQLHEAQLLVWVGPVLEKFLEKTVATLDARTQVLTLFKTPGLMRLKVRSGENWEPHLHDSESEEHFDAHLWLDPQNAKVWVATIAQTLSQLDSENASRYAANAARLQTRLEQLDQTVRQELVTFKNQPFLVFHDAYQYFTHRYELMEEGTITLSPDSSPSIKRMQDLRKLIQDKQVRCVFSEPQFPSSLVATVTEGTKVRHGILDPIGAQFPAGTEAYFTLLQNLVKSFRECFSD
ncbi:MAG: hypothetical protein BWK79_11820 [Beggiatoa sp. IS2]|nr:MAG: hypothetical protein BWK79_11820 [Beggiatoa sp. IS2]